MSYFKRALERWLEKDHTQSELEVAAKLPKGLVFKMLRGQMPRDETLTRILDAVDEPSRRDMLTSYLIDNCPDPFRANVDINWRETSAVVKEDNGKLADTDKFERALEWLRKRGAHDSALASYIIDFYELMGQRKDPT